MSKGKTTKPRWWRWPRLRDPAPPVAALPTPALLGAPVIPVEDAILSALVVFQALLLDNLRDSPERDTAIRAIVTAYNAAMDAWRATAHSRLR